MATHFSVLTWRIPWTEEPGGLHAVHGVTKSWTRLSMHTCTPQGNLPHPGIKTMFLVSPAFVGGGFTTKLPGQGGKRGQNSPLGPALQSNPLAFTLPDRGPES